MRIANFNASLIPQQDGVTRVMFNLTRGALQYGHDVLLVGSSVPKINTWNVPLVKVPSFSAPGRGEYKIAYPGYYHFAKELHAWKPDIIHIHSPCPLGFAAARFARDYGIPVVATYHTHFPTYLQYYNYDKYEERLWKLLRRLYNPLDATFVPALSVLAAIQAKGVRHAEYLPNAVNTTAFKPTFRSNEWRDSMDAGNRKIVLFTSRFVKEKNLRVLAATYDILKEQRKDFVMVMVGDGPERRKLEQRMRGAKFTGWLDGDPLSTSYASSDMFVFPSISETFGLVTVEAMASGIPVAAARAGGAADIIRHDYSGLLAEPDDPRALAASVSLLLDHPELRERLTVQGLQRSKEFEWGPMWDQLFHRYEEIIDEKNASHTKAAFLAV